MYLANKCLLSMTLLKNTRSVQCLWSYVTIPSWDLCLVSVMIQFFLLTQPHDSVLIPVGEHDIRVSDNWIISPEPVVSSLAYPSVPLSFSHSSYLHTSDHTRGPSFSLLLFKDHIYHPPLKSPSHIHRPHCSEWGTVKIKSVWISWSHSDWQGARFLNKQLPE